MHMVILLKIFYCQNAFYTEHVLLLIISYFYVGQTKSDFLKDSGHGWIFF